jgi:glycosyltransferase involved in cell wall biosynthesis
MNLSVIVPAYNAEATLPALLDSLSALGFSSQIVIFIVGMVLE